MQYSNAQKLAAVLSDWARPALTQLFSTKLGSIPFVQTMQGTLKSSGLVGMSYNIVNDLMPFMNNSVQAIVQPIIESYVAKVPDASLPQIAHAMVDAAVEQPHFSLLDGLIEFEPEDMAELKNLLEKNLPLSATEGYQVIK